ncbi:MAG: hypothetical protein K8F91_01795, partial [Candidatus Obscuribacterales bacterium]|nr:hypothetical protein [Candidatus Obscuribacterales bacterium]
ECYEFSIHAFDMAERLQTPVFVLTDLDLAMNNWMAEPFQYPDKPFDRGKVLTAEDLDRLGGFSRYKDVDGDAIPYRTLPGTKHPKAAYFTRGSGHNENAAYTEKPEDYLNLMDRLKRKWETAQELIPHGLGDKNKDAKIGLIAFGSTHWAILECRDQLAELGLPTSYFRIRALPFTYRVKDFVDAHDHVYVVEQNRDGQMLDLIRMEFPMLATKLQSVRHYSGLPIDAQFITDHIVEQEK